MMVDTSGFGMRSFHENALDSRSVQADQHLIALPRSNMECGCIFHHDMRPNSLHGNGNLITTFATAIPISATILIMAAGESVHDALRHVCRGQCMYWLGPQQQQCSPSASAGELASSWQPESFSRNLVRTQLHRPLHPLMCSPVSRA